MSRPLKNPDDRPEVKDEPGAAERFDRIVKRALTTPPKHKTGPEKESDPVRASKKGQQKREGQ